MDVQTVEIQCLKGLCTVQWQIGPIKNAILASATSLRPLAFPVNVTADEASSLRPCEPNTVTIAIYKKHTTPKRR